MEKTVTIELPEEEAKTFFFFREHQRNIEELEHRGGFFKSKGRVTYHLDKDGNIQKVEATVIS